MWGEHVVLIVHLEDRRRERSQFWLFMRHEAKVLADMEPLDYNGPAPTHRRRPILGSQYAFLILYLQYMSIL